MGEPTYVDSHSHSLKLPADPLIDPQISFDSRMREHAISTQKGLWLDLTNLESCSCKAKGVIANHYTVMKGN